MFGARLLPSVVALVMLAGSVRSSINAEAIRNSFYQSKGDRECSHDKFGMNSLGGRNNFWKTVEPAFYLKPGSHAELVTIGIFEMPYIMHGKKSDQFTVEYLRSGETRISPKNGETLTLAPWLQDDPEAGPMTGTISYNRFGPPQDAAYLQEIGLYVCDMTFNPEWALVITGTCLGQEESSGRMSYQVMMTYGHERMYLVIVYSNGGNPSFNQDQMKHYMRVGDDEERKISWPVDMTKSIIVYEMTQDGPVLTRHGQCTPATQLDIGEREWEYTKNRKAARKQCAAYTTEVGLGSLDGHLWRTVDPTFYQSSVYNSDIMPIGRIEIPYNIHGQEADYWQVDYLSTGATRISSAGASGVTIAPMMYDMEGGSTRLGRITYHTLGPKDTNLLNEVDFFICDASFRSQRAIVVSGECLGNPSGPFGNYEMIIAYGNGRTFVVITYGSIVKNHHHQKKDLAHYIRLGTSEERTVAWSVHMSKPIIVHELTDATSGAITKRSKPCMGSEMGPSFNKNRNAAATQCTSHSIKSGVTFSSTTNNYWMKVDPNFYMRPGSHSSSITIGSFEMPYIVHERRAIDFTVEYLSSGATKITSNGLADVTISPMVYDMNGGSQRLGEVTYYRFGPPSDHAQMKQITHLICDTSFKATWAMIVYGQCLGNIDGPSGNYQLILTYGHKRMFIVIIYGSIFKDERSTSHYIRIGDVTKQFTPSMEHPIIVLELTTEGASISSREQSCSCLSGQCTTEAPSPTTSHRLLESDISKPKDDILDEILIGDQPVQETANQVVIQCTGLLCMPGQSTNSKQDRIRKFWYWNFREKLAKMTEQTNVLFQKLKKVTRNADTDSCEDQSEIMKITTKLMEIYADQESVRKAKTIVEMELGMPQTRPANLTDWQ